MVTIRTIIGYRVEFKGHPDWRRKPIKLDIENGIKAWKLYAIEEKSRIPIRGSAYAASEIASIEPEYAWSNHAAQKALHDGSGITEKQLEEKIRKSIAPPVLPVAIPQLKGGDTHE
jgi:hypothetical protein